MYVKNIISKSDLCFSISYEEKYNLEIILFFFSYSLVLMSTKSLAGIASIIISRVCARAILRMLWKRTVLYILKNSVVLLRLSI